MTILIYFQIILFLIFKGRVEYTHYYFKYFFFICILYYYMFFTLHIIIHYSIYWIVITNVSYLVTMLRILIFTKTDYNPVSQIFNKIIGSSVFSSSKIFSFKNVTINTFIFNKILRIKKICSNPSKKVKKKKYKNPQHCLTVLNSILQCIVPYYELCLCVRACCILAWTSCRSGGRTRWVCCRPWRGTEQQAQYSPPTIRNKTIVRLGKEKNFRPCFI